MGIEVKGVWKSFDSKVVLRDFGLALPDNGVIAFMGQSGCGKTTLMRIIAGLEKPDSGKVVWDRDRKLSVVFQEDRLINSVTVLGNVMAVLDSGSRNNDNKDLALRWLDNMGLKETSNLLPAELSGGMRRRLSIARAMAYGGDLFILDEPFAGLDDATRARIYPYVFDRSNSDRLTILVTHDRKEAECLADRLIVLDDL